MEYHGVEIPSDRIAEFCRTWRINEFALFGSVLRPGFRPDSDVDVLIAFVPDAGPSRRLQPARNAELGGCSIPVCRRAPRDAPRAAGECRSPRRAASAAPAVGC